MPDEENITSSNTIPNTNTNTNNNNNHQYGQINADPLALSSSDNPGMQLTMNPFNGHNINTWTISVRMALGAKNKYCFVDGSYKKPPLTDSATLQQWVRVDYMVRCWLLNSMAPNISAGFMYAASAKQLWDEIAERYGLAIGPLLFQLNRELANTTQGNLGMAEYYTKMKVLWDEIDTIEGIPECTSDVLDSCSCGLFRKIVQIQTRNRTIQFLMGVNEVYETVRTYLLSMEPMYSANKAFSMLLQAEQQRQLSGMAQQPQEATAFSVNKTDQTLASKLMQKRYFLSKKPRYEKPDESHLKCGKCNKTGHTEETCFFIHGFPDWFKGSKSKALPRKYAGQVSEMPEAYASYESPLESTDVNTEAMNQTGKKMDSAFISAIVQEVAKMFKGKQTTQEASSSNLNFSGPHY